MGTTTPHLNLYKADPVGELVDVTEHLNENLDKVDARALNVDSRLTTLESLEGIVSWEEWTIDFLISRGHGAISFAYSDASDFSETLRVGDIVSVAGQIQVTSPTTTWTGPLVLRLPLQYDSRRFFIGGAHIITPANILIPLIVAPEGTGVEGAQAASAVFYRVESPSSLATVPAAPAGMGIPQNSKIRFMFQYRTNGLEVPV